MKRVFKRDFSLSDAMIIFIIYLHFQAFANDDLKPAMQPIDSLKPLYTESMGNRLKATFSDYKTVNLMYCDGK